MGRTSYQKGFNGPIRARARNLQAKNRTLVTGAARASRLATKADNPTGIDPSKGPQPKDFEHWLLLAFYQRGRCLGRGEMSLRNIICIREEEGDHR